MTREVPLTRGYVALVDDADYERVIALKWRAVPQKTNVYASGRRGGQMHRFIIDAPTGVQVDHVNGNALDNRRANLRLCTPQQNQGNSRRRPFDPVKTPYRGVQFHAHRNGRRYQAKIMVNGKKKGLGSYHSAVEAALAYDTAAKQFFGEFARPNFPDTGGIDVT